MNVLAEKLDALSFEEYCAQREQRDVVEREFETAIEACIDIWKMLLTADGGTIPQTNADVFRQLGQRDILETETAQKMAQAAGFRNILSHRYGNEIDNEDVYNVLQGELPVFRDYLTQVRNFLE